MKRAFLIAAAGAIFATATARADFMTIGDVVGSATGGSAPNANQTGAGEIGFYIPLRESASGTYGVDAGTSPDTGYGYGYTDATALYMFLEYDLSGIPDPFQDAELTFDFQDLDLEPDNDPDYFYESISFTIYDARGTGLTMSQVLFHRADVISNSIDITGEISGANNDTTIRFYGTGLDDIIGDILTAGDDKLYVRMGFGSATSPPKKGTNTLEKVLSSALAFPAPEEIPVPEPSSLALLGLGVAGMCGFGVRRRRTDRNSTA